MKPNRKARTSEYTQQQHTAQQTQTDFLAITLSRSLLLCCGGYLIPFASVRLCSIPSFSKRKNAHALSDTGDFLTQKKAHGSSLTPIILPTILSYPSIFPYPSMGYRIVHSALEILSQVLSLIYPIKKMQISPTAPLNDNRDPRTKKTTRSAIPPPPHPPQAPPAPHSP